MLTKRRFHIHIIRCIQIQQRGHWQHMIHTMSHIIRMERVATQLVEHYPGQIILVLRTIMVLDRMEAKHPDMDLGNVVNPTMTNIRLG